MYLRGTTTTMPCELVAAKISWNFVGNRPWVIVRTMGHTSNNPSINNDTHSCKGEECIKLNRLIVRSLLSWLSKNVFKLVDCIVFQPSKAIQALLTIKVTQNPQLGKTCTHLQSKIRTAPLFAEELVQEAPVGIRHLFQLTRDRHSHGF